MSNAILPRDEKAEQAQRWLSECLDIVRRRMLAAGYPIDGYEISLTFRDGEVFVKVTR